MCFLRRGIPPLKSWWTSHRTTSQTSPDTFITSSTSRQSQTPAMVLCYVRSMELSVVFVLLLAFLLAEGRRDFLPTPRIQYSREFLLEWGNHPDFNPPSDLPTSMLDSFDPNQGQKTFSNEPHKRVRKRGRRGGVRERMKRQSLSRIPLPSIILQFFSIVYTHFLRACLILSELYTQIKKHTQRAKPLNSPAK